MVEILSPILLAIHIMLAASLIGVVLLQKSEGGMGGLGGGGMSGFMTSRGSANLLTRTTRWLAGAFMVTSLVLAWIATQSPAPSSIVTPQPAGIEFPSAPAEQPSSGQATVPAPDSTAAGSTPATPAPSTPTVPTTQ